MRRTALFVVDAVEIGGRQPERNDFSRRIVRHRHCGARGTLSSTG
jgi:hypothetical protein